MSKTKLIRCKTPHDIIVIQKREDMNLVYELAENKQNCGHNHLIVCGDLYFRTEHKYYETLHRRKRTRVPRKSDTA